MSADTAASTRAPEPPGRPAIRRGVRASLERAWLALAVYATVRAAGIGCVAVGAWRTGKHPRTQLGHYWDSLWYVGIAQHGYGTSRPSVSHPGLGFSDLAFFPLYPALIRAVTSVVPLSAVTAGLLITWVTAGLAAWGIHAVGERLYGRRVALMLVALWGLLPHAVVESMAYTESLLTALAAWSLYALLTRLWLWAGALALCAGPRGPTGSRSRRRCAHARPPRSGDAAGGCPGGCGRARRSHRWAGSATPAGWECGAAPGAAIWTSRTAGAPLSISV
ncbi:hypothetical protein SSPO_049020 [Streptomyces antimycoticus]|uniref:Glycosyltransferase RgtA/B/C/D-like domain-containing protein n=1 Tax=Streptomyces antimycoticus TaxID=68175 RepID=A0A499UKB1_9ACTN|nr:hypothetical protein SSPO_049020 [Streptomyces antimycoticus]